MGQFSFKGQPCSQCATCRYYKYNEIGRDGNKSIIPHACTNQTTQSNAYDLYGKDECAYGYGTTNPCRAYASTSKKPVGFRQTGRLVAAVLAGLSLITMLIMLIGSGGGVGSSILFTVPFIISFLVVYFCEGWVKKSLFLCVGIVWSFIAFGAFNYRVPLILVACIGFILSYIIAMICPVDYDGQ